MPNIETSIVLAIGVACVVLGAGFYNAYTRRQTARQLTVLLFNDKRFELLQLLVSTQTVRHKTQQAARTLQIKAHNKVNGLSSHRKKVEGIIHLMELTISSAQDDMAADRFIEAQINHIIYKEDAPLEAIQKISHLLGEAKVRYSEAVTFEETFLHDLVSSEIILENAH